MRMRPPRLVVGLSRLVAGTGRRALGGASCLVLAGAVLAGAAGCDPSARADPARSPQSERPPLPAFEAGGACQLLDYDVIKQAIGISFAVAAAAQEGDTHTCVVQARRDSFPDLTLSVSTSTADEKLFQSVAAPKGATAVTGLGLAAYTIAVVAAGDAGPGVEVGWLTSNQRLMVLRVRLAAKAGAEEAAAIGPQLVELAKTIDVNSI